MPCIDRPIPWNVESKEFVFTVAGGFVFSIATAALSYFLISAPTNMNVSHIVCFTLLSISDTAGFATFVVGMYLYNRNQRKELKELIDDLKNVKPVVVEDVELPTSKFTSLDYIEQVRLDLPPLFEALSKFLQSFVIGYYKTEDQEPPDLKTIPNGIDTIRNQIDTFLQNPSEVLRVAIGIAAFSFIDETKMGPLLKKTDRFVIEGLADTLYSVDAEYKTQGLILRQILQVIANQANVIDGTLRSRIRETRKAYNEMLVANTEEDKEERLGNYKVALISLIDHLYSNANIPQDKINSWTAHLIPPFLEQWRSSLFKIIGDSMTHVHSAFNKNGIFNDSAWKTKLKIAKTFPGTFIYPKIQTLIETLPLTIERKVALLNAVKILFPVIIDPFFCGTFEEGHPFRKKVEDILGSKFKLPDVKQNNWKSYIDAYSFFFNKLSNKISQNVN